MKPRRRSCLVFLGAGMLLHLPASLAAEAAGATVQGAGRRVALVMGNASYALPANRLDNPVNDARLVSQGLRQHGFDVTMLNDATTAQMTRAVDDFASHASGADLALVYFAGHAVAVDDVNYLFGVDLNVPVADVRIDATQRQSLSMRRLLQALRRVNVRARLVVLDACRTNLTRGRQLGGLVRVVPAGGELIAYSTQPGATAEDGFGSKGPTHSPYAYYFAQALEAMPPSQGVEDFFKQLTADVQVATGYRQIPHYASSLVGQVSLADLVDGTTRAAPLGTATLGRGVRPKLEKGLIKARMNAWEEEIERGAYLADVSRLESLRARAALGDVVAMTTLGLIHEQGEALPQDDKAAAEWYRQAAAQDFSPAQTYLGELMLMGRGVPRDYPAAERLLQQAAEAGHQRAVVDLIDLRMRQGEPPAPDAMIQDLGGALFDYIKAAGSVPR